ncbi:MAG: glutathione S-transferase N-terminal domain-containing protein [Candidatus Diapherotrites archaeon]|nr:glutathione S-transferase N-terminal domain-containing protein [Candidatus Diapherotrites archaeon]
MPKNSKNKVVVYSTPTCPYCIIAKKFLKENGVDYVEYNVAADKEKAMEMYEKSGQLGVPVIDINGKIIVGFDKGAILKALSA